MLQLKSHDDNDDDASPTYRLQLPAVRWSAFSVSSILQGGGLKKLGEDKKLQLSVRYDCKFLTEKIVGAYNFHFAFNFFPKWVIFFHWL